MARDKTSARRRLFNPASFTLTLPSPIEGEVTFGSEAVRKYDCPQIHRVFPPLPRREGMKGRVRIQDSALESRSVQCILRLRSE